MCVPHNLLPLVPSHVAVAAIQIESGLFGTSFLYIWASSVKCRVQQNVHYIHYAKYYVHHVCWKLGISACVCTFALLHSMMEPYGQHALQIEQNYAQFLYDSI